MFGVFECMLLYGSGRDSSFERGLHIAPAGRIIHLPIRTGANVSYRGWREQSQLCNTLVMPPTV